MTRVVLHPGRVVSTTDGDEHLISWPMLAELYGIYAWPGNCQLISFHVDGRPPPWYRPKPDDIHLYPRSDGEYRYISELVKNHAAVLAAQPKVDYGKRVVKIRKP